MLSWTEAAKHPRRTVISMSMAGLVAGGIVSYVLFGNSIGFGIVLGVGVALILGRRGWKTVHDPERSAELTHERRSRTAVRAAVTESLSRS
jgi:hypothetical protein